MAKEPSAVVSFDVSEWKHKKKPPSLSFFCTTTTLRLTNSTGLTTMPGICRLPKAFSTVVCDQSCSTITAVDAGFLQSCAHVKAVDLASLNRVVAVGDNFLFACSGLKNLNLASFSNVLTIGDHFLHRCFALEALDLDPLQRVTTVGSHFLGCSKVQSLDFSKMNSLAKIGHSFLYLCMNITSLDLSALSNVSTVGDRFLCGCSSVTTLLLFTPLTSFVSIGDSFLTGCSALRLVDLQPLSSVTTIGDAFLGACASLASLDLSPLRSVSSIGNNFLFGCSGLAFLDLRVLISVTIIRGNFLRKCSSLTSVGVIEDTQGWSATISSSVVVLNTQQTILESLSQMERTFIRTVSSLRSSQQRVPKTTAKTRSVTHIAFASLSFVALLGEGGQGTVSLFMDNKTQELVAVKCVPVSNNSKALSEEYTKLAKLNHPNIVRVFQLIEDTEVPGYFGKHDCIIMEHALGSASKLAVRKRNTIVTYPDLQKWFDVALQTLNGLQALHDNKMLHNDLKPDNILMVQEGGKIVYKLADLGLGAEVDDSPSATNILDGTVGTRCYIAPESIEEQKYSSASDVYAWACTMGYIATGKPPKAYQQGRPEDHRGFTAKELQEDGTPLPVDVAELLVRCFSYDKHARPKVAALMEELNKRAPP